MISHGADGPAFPPGVKDKAHGGWGGEAISSALKT